jgi:hypothetical protein
MALDSLLIEVLACPLDKQPLRYYAELNLLVNPRLNKSFRIDGDIPVLIPTEATDLDAATAADLEQRFSRGEAVETGFGHGHKTK